MDRRRVYGIILLASGLLLIIFSCIQVTKYVTLTGMNGLTAQAIYNSPFPFHGPLTVLIGVCGLILFLFGLHLLSPRKN